MAIFVFSRYVGNYRDTAGYDLSVVMYTVLVHFKEHALISENRLFWPQKRACYYIWTLRARTSMFFKVH